MDTPITRAEHEEFRKRMEEQHSRNAKRIEILEEKTEKQGELMSEIHELALSVKGMQEQLTNLNKRIATIEGRDGENWRTVVKYLITGVVSAAIGFVLSQIGIG